MNKATRERVCNIPNDVEWSYVCGCGYRDYVSSEGCNCYRCKELGDKYGRPMTRCPECGSEFVTTES